MGLLADPLSQSLEKVALRQKKGKSKGEKERNEIEDRDGKRNRVGGREREREGGGGDARKHPNGPRSDLMFTVHFRITS